MNIPWDQLTLHDAFVARAGTVGVHVARVVGALPFIRPLQTLRVPVAAACGKEMRKRNKVSNAET